ncbi:MAG: hypothetical protein KF774_18540 [Planctomyces sp.]|nr:hypothetical protein [Planctomyces sp.]
MKLVLPLLVAAALATAAGTAGSSQREHFLVTIGVQGTAADPNQSAEDTNERPIMGQRKNVALVTGIFGAALGLLFGLAAGVGTGRGAVPAAGVGLVLGVLAGAAGGFLSHLAFEQIQNVTQEPVAVAPVTHLSLWLPLCLAVAIAVSLTAPKGRLGSLLGSAALAALIAAALFPVAAALALPMRESDRPLPEGYETIGLWFGIVSVSLAVLLGRALRPTAVVAVSAAAPATPPAPATGV